MQTTTKAKSGGCGGGTASGGKGYGCGGNCGGGCGCKPARLPEAAAALCSPCETASFVRPRFFAGQLLTEDDLSALIDYVVSKNRFHNSRLFGGGVVCGLLVECGPCDGQIVIDPGYALDCCGNDLVLTCAQTLDMAPMIRALAAHKDCGCTDPCADATVAQTSTPTNKEAEQNPPPKPCKTYCLYARYGERPDQPVAAYPVAGDCDTASCEPTRIVEGITFELRCPTTIHHPNIHDAQKCCREMVKSEELLDLAMNLRYLAGWIDEAYAPEVSAALRARVKESLDVEPLLSGLHGADRVRAMTRYVASNHSALLRVEPTKLGLTPDEAKQLDGHVKALAAELTNVHTDDLSPIAAALAEAASEASSKAELRAKSPASASPYFMTAHLMEVVQKQIGNAAFQLQAAAGCGTPKIHTDCCLQKELDEMSVSFRATPDAHQIRLMRDVSLRVIGTIERFLIDCNCAAINPPCPPCDDPGVLLACIDVDHCKVVRICNTVREYVYAPSTLRYWDAIHLPYHGYCCGCEKRQVEPGHRIIRGELDNRYELEKLAALGGAHASMHVLMSRPTTARDVAYVPQAEHDELKARFSALEKKLARLMDKGEKPAKETKQ